MPATTGQLERVSLAAIREAARGLEGVAIRTPLIDLPALAALAGAPVAAKCEYLQPVGAFKIRGAYTAIARVAREGRVHGVVTQSSGNHGQAVAFAARQFGLRAVVVMPSSTPRVKVEGVRRYGGEVVFAGAIRSAEQRVRAEQLAADEGLAMIPPYDHPDVVAGQGTTGLEILEQRPEVETILVPVSGGGLLAGICVAVAGLKPSVRVVGVEPEGAPKLSAALAAGTPQTLERTQSLADGLLARSIGDYTFPILRDLVSEAVRVSEEEIAGAVRFLHREAGLTVEPSGAVTTAALLAGRFRPTGSTVVVISGGNVDPELFQRLVRE
jgi:threonine dehydratase